MFNIDLFMRMLRRRRGAATNVNSGGGATITAVVPGMGTGGSAYVLGTLDGTWTSGC